MGGASAGQSADGPCAGLSAHGLPWAVNDHCVWVGEHLEISGESKRCPNELDGDVAGADVDDQARRPWGAGSFMSMSTSSAGGWLPKLRELTLVTPRGSGVRV